MKKATKLTIIITSAVLLVALITLAIVLIVANNNREKTETSIMTCTVNPQVQFVLNGNDKVMKVVALNSDGQDVILNNEFVGLKADKAIELFVSVSTKAGYLDIDTTGTTVEINLTGLKDNYDSLKEKVVAAANQYFDNNGIIAGAIAEVEDLKDAIKTLKPSAKNLEDKTKEQLLQNYLNIESMVKDVNASLLSKFYEAYDAADATYTEALEYVDEAIKVQNDLLAKATTDAAKAVIQAEIDRLNTVKGSAEKTYKRALSDLYKVQKLTEESINNIKTAFETKIADNQAKIADHMTNFNANKADIQAKITEYRNSLVAE